MQPSREEAGRTVSNNFIMTADPVYISTIGNQPPNCVYFKTLALVIEVTRMTLTLLVLRQEHSVKTC